MTIRSHGATTSTPLPDFSGEASSSSTAPREPDSSSAQRGLSRAMALKQLRPREASRIDDSLASPPVDARKKKSLTERIKGAISGRQFSVAAIIPGTGRTVNRPLRAGLPADAATGEDAIMEEARLVSSVAESLAESIGRPEAALWKRPAPSKAYRMMTKVIPWMKPAPLPEISTIHGHRASAARAYQAYGAPARGRAEISEGAKKLLGQIDEKRKALDEAVGKFNAAHAAREHGRSAASGSAQTRELAEQRALAAREVRAASSALHETISGADLVGLKGLSYLADQLEKGDAFAHKRINELQTKAHALRNDAYDRRDAIDLELKARMEEARVLKSLDGDLAAAEKIALEAQARLSELDQQLAALPPDTAASSSTEAPLSPRRARLNNEIAKSRAVLDRAQAVQQHGLQALDGIDAKFAQVNTRIAELLKQRPATEAQRDEAERSLAWLAEASSRLVKKTAARVEPEAGIDTAAIDELQERFVEELCNAPHMFGAHPTPELQAALGALSARLKETGASAKLPLMMGMEAVTNTLADVTRSDPERAVRMLDALSGKPVEHWTELAQARSARGTAADPADPADRTATDVLAFNRLIAALPRGSELLHALSRDGKEASPKAQMQALHVFWTADDASNKESDPSVRAWLGQAKRVALAGCRGETDAEFDDVDHAAYHAVRNGYVSNAPGSLYDQHNARMQKAITEWVLRAASGNSVTNDAARPVGWRRLVPKLSRAERRRQTQVEPRAGLTPPHAGVPAAQGEQDAQDAAAADNAQAMLRYRAMLEARHGRGPAGGPAGGDTPEASPSSRASRASAWRSFVPTLQKTPFRKRTLNVAYDVAESMGLDSTRRRVDRVVRKRMESMDPLIAASRQNGGGEGMLDAVFAEALVGYLKIVDNRGRHLSKVKLTGRDAQAIMQHLPEVARNVHAERFHAFLKEVAPHGVTAYEALGNLDTRLRSRVPEALQPPKETPVDEDLADAVRLMKRQRLADKRDVVTFFKPFILDMALRDKVRVGGGGTLGLGLPTLPYGPETPTVSPLVTAEMSRSKEAYAQLFMPVLGIEMMFGKVETKAKEGTLGVVAGHALGKIAAVQGTASVHASSQHAQTNATLMRFFRRRHQDETMRGNMLNALDSMVRWDMIEPERGRPYSGPLEAVFARNPEVSVSQVDAVADTTALGAAVSARLPYAKFAEKDGIAQTIRAEPSLAVEASRSYERRDETGGHVNVYAAVGDSAQQRASAGMAVTGAPLSYLPPSGHPHKHEGTQREAVGLQLGITRDIAWAMEKHEISPFLLDGKQDGDLDRHYATPADMLKEISANREQWLMRCVETLEPDAHGNTDTPDNRMRAGVLLDEFEQEIQRLGKNSKYCLYNVNYSMRGAASEWIDGYRGLAQLARKRGDAQAERRAQEAIDEILVNRGTWRPLMLIVRERAKDSTTIGWRNLLRWQRMHNVDGQRTAAQFPPP